MAQLVARFHGMEEVRGSNPLSSTIRFLYKSLTIAVTVLVTLGRFSHPPGCAGILVRTAAAGADRGWRADRRTLGVAQWR